MAAIPYRLIVVLQYIARAASAYRLHVPSLTHLWQTLLAQTVARLLQWYGYAAAPSATCTFQCLCPASVVKGSRGANKRGRLLLLPSARKRGYTQQSGYQSRSRADQGYRVQRTREM